MPLSLRAAFASRGAETKFEPEPIPIAKLESILVNPHPRSLPQPQPNEQPTSQVPDLPTEPQAPNPPAATQLQFETPLHPKYNWDPNSDTISSKPLNRIKPVGKIDPDRRKGLSGFQMTCQWCECSVCFWVKRRWEANERGKVHERECAKNPGRETRGVGKR